MAPVRQSFGAELTGIVRDETGGVLAGVSVELRRPGALLQVTATDTRGIYRFMSLDPGAFQVSFSLPNFATIRRDVAVPATGSELRVDIVLHLSLSADVVVTGRNTFINLADAEDPAGNLVGIALSASQGAITAHQLDARPVMRAGEVLEAVPGVIISQHSGEGKANQYYLRGFNLDHGTDFATTVAGMPVNLPTHGHGHGYSDLSFLVPEIVSSVQYSKGPYFAEQGDFATAGAATINYVSALARPMVEVAGGGDGYGRVVAAVSPRTGSGTLLAVFEGEHDDGPWVIGDNYRKANGLVRYTRGDAVNGLSITAMGYRGIWRSTDQIPRRAIDRGLINRFAAIDPTDGGDSYRYSGSVEWQSTSGSGTTKLTAYGIGYAMSLFSNFTLFLDDPEHGDQFEQADRRFISGAKLSHRRVDRWGDRAVQNTFGGMLRYDDISKVGLYHTEARARLGTMREDSVGQTSGALYVQNEVEWAPWLRTIAGIRGDEYRFMVRADDPVNGGRVIAGIVSPKGGVVVGPFEGTEFYANAGLGFHSNDARGATIARDPKSGAAVDRVTPLVRARGGEVGVRSVAIPRLQSTLSLWTLSLDSELLFVGDAGSTEAGRPSRRYGLELANYYSPRPWLTFDADASWSRSHFTNHDPAGNHIPGAVRTVVSAGATVDGSRGPFGRVRVRYFGPRPLVEDNSVRSKATSAVNLGGGYKFSRGMRVVVDVFNLLNAEDSDIDYYYRSRLPGEPAEGVNDIHLHPTPPRTVRLGMTLSF